MIRDGVATEIIIVSKMLSYVLTIYPPPEIGVFLKILVFSHLQQYCNAKIRFFLESISGHCGLLCKDVYTPFDAMPYVD